MLHRLPATGARLLLAGLLTGAVALAIPPHPASAAEEVELLGVAELPGTSTDQSGLQDLLGDTPHNRLGGLSAIDYSGDKDLYFVLSDRGPQDGSARYACRWHTLELKVPHDGQGRPTARLVGTTLLTTAEGKPYVGLAAAFNPNGPDGDSRLDPEGIRRGPSGTVFVSDEYGPKVVEFSAKGRALRSLPVPARFLIEHPAATKDEEISLNSSGRTSNGGFEGLAIGPDGKHLYALTQVPLLQDTKVSKKGKRKGRYCRLLEFDLGSDSTREYVYPLDQPQNKLSEILAIGDRTFLVIERDGEAGPKAAYKRVMKIDLRDATDTSDIKSFAGDKLPKGVQPIAKSTFIDLLDRRFGIAGPNFPEKQEGLAWGPALPDGRGLLWVCVDNDFSATAPSRFFAFAVRRPTTVSAR
jgi:hypothetical protein